MYTFYRSNDKLIKPIIDNLNINNQFELYDILKQCWSKDTCAPRMRERWSKTDYTVGQCSITAFLVQDLFGGDVYGIKLDDGNYHCFNVINDIKIDLTSEQFKYKLNYDDVIIQSRDIHFKKEEKYNRYLLLKKLVFEKIIE